MTSLSALFLSAMLTYGIWALGLATLAGAIGVPVPTSMLVIAAGALARQGVLDWQWAVALAILGAIAGDFVSYLIGRFGARLAPQRLQSTVAGRRAQATFARWGGLAVFLSRFLLLPLALPINLMAGSTSYTPWRYMSFVVTGEVIWVLAFGGMGYAFASSWETLSDSLGSMGGVAAGVAVAVAGGAYLLRRLWLRHGQQRPLVAVALS